jgi:hypothetical protein
MVKKSLLVGVLSLTIGLLSVLPARAAVNVNVNVGPPPVVFAEPPHLVVVPGSPVYYAPEVDYNVFVYRNHYWSLHDGAWFYAPTHRGPWRVVESAQVPRAVRAVPVKYYKVPPGHAKKFAEHCPPGHAKHGRC